MDMKELIVHRNDIIVCEFLDINLTISVAVSTLDRIQRIHLIIPEDYSM